MHEATVSPLAAWDSQFVAIALLAETRRRSTTKATDAFAIPTDAFATPTILHFQAILLVSAILSAPRPSLLGVGLALGLCGSVGVAYVVIVIRRVRRQTIYEPVLEDWVWYTVLPLVAYASLAVAAAVLGRHAFVSPFAIAGTALLLLFVRDPQRMGCRHLHRPV